MKKAIIFLENYSAGGADKMAKLLAENIPFKEVYFFVNARNDFSVLEKTPFPAHIHLIKYNLVTIAELGSFAKKFEKSKFIYWILRIFNLVIRYPLIVFSIFYFYCKFKKLDVDIYLSNNGGYPGGEYNRSSTVAAILLKKIKVFHLFHNIPTRAPKILQILENFYDSYLDKNAKFIGVAQSIISGMYIKRNFKNSMIKISNGIEMNTQKEYPLNSILKVIHIGILDDRKNQNFLLDVAIELIHRGVKEFHFTFIGKEGFDIGYKNMLNTKILDNNLQDKIQIINFQKDPIPFYKDSDLFLLSSRVESLPIVSLEALSVGLPIVSTDTGDTCIQAIDDFNGFLVEQNNVKKYADKVEFFIKDPEKRKEFGVNSFKLFKENFTIDRMIDQYKNVIYEEQK